jgi:hypothetical protein
LLKSVLFSLLAADTAYFVLAGTASKAIDAAAWLVLLVLYEIETRFGARAQRRGIAIALRALRLAAAAGVIAATIRYLFEDDVLDAVNSVLWIGVVVLLEIELRRPALVRRARVSFVTAGAVLYGGLALLVAAWAWRQEWFDAYDAMLWLLAFATIEMDVLRPKASGARVTP